MQTIRRSPARGLEPRNCPTCGDTFVPYRETQRACSRKCRDALGAVPAELRMFDVEFTCRTCGEKHIGKNSVKGGRFYFCEKCAPAAAEARRLHKQELRRNRVTTAAQNRSYALKKYGLTVVDYAAILDAQGGVCRICGEPPKPDGVRAASKLHVDHNHTTGQVRGLLCNHCNRGIGAFRDRPDLLELAIAYLRTYEP